MPPLGINKMPGNYKPRESGFGWAKSWLSVLLTPRQRFALAKRQIHAFEVVAFFQGRGRVTLCHQNRIRETEGGKAKEGRNDEEDLAEGKRLDAD